MMAKEPFSKERCCLRKKRTVVKNRIRTKKGKRADRSGTNGPMSPMDGVSKIGGEEVLRKKAIWANAIRSGAIRDQEGQEQGGTDYCKEYKGKKVPPGEGSISHLTAD